MSKMQSFLYKVKIKYESNCGYVVIDEKGQMLFSDSN